MSLFGRDANLQHADDARLDDYGSPLHYDVLGIEGDDKLGAVAMKHYFRV
jgi:hypothetical protein